MMVKLLTEHHLEFLSLTGVCGGSAESTLDKMSNCWKSQSMAHIIQIAEEVKEKDEKVKSGTEANKDQTDIRSDEAV